ncbi:hypothetical protein KC345_g1749 [Hortaea werneckii]|nr:hypothetical protein KC345_g1749 [Hortaea werneckii]
MACQNCGGFHSTGQLCPGYPVSSPGMPGTAGGAGDFKQSQQDFAFDDGRTKMQYHSSSTSWSSTSQSGFQDRITTPMLQLPPAHSPFSIQSPQHPLDWHNNVHNQAMQQANQLHNQSILHAQQMMSSAMQDAFRTGQADEPEQRTPALPAPPTPSQQYVQTPPSDVCQQQTLRLPAPSNLSQQDREESRSQHQQLLATMEQRWASQEKEFSRQMQGLKIDLQEAKNSSVQDRKEHDAKDRQIAALQSQIASQNQAQMELQQRHTQDMAQMAQAVASNPLPQAPAFDMGVLQQLIAEVRASRVNPADIENLVSGALAQRMSGLATKEDMQSASGAVGKALQSLDNNASEGRIQRAVEKAINKVVEQKKAHVQQTQKKIGASQQQPSEMSPAISKLSPGPPAYPSRPVGDIATMVSPPSKKAKALPAPASDARSTIGQKLEPSNPKVVYGSNSVVCSGKMPTAHQSTEPGHAMQLFQDDGAGRISTSTKKAKPEPAQIEYPQSTVSRALESSQPTKALPWHQDAASSISKAPSPSVRQARDNESVVSTSSRRSKRGDVLSITAAAAGNESNTASKAHKSTGLAEQAAVNRLANPSMLAIREAGESEIESTTSKASKRSQLTAANLAQLPNKNFDRSENTKAKSKVTYASPEGHNEARYTVSGRVPKHDAKARHNASDAASEARSVGSSARSSGSRASKALRMSELRPPGQTGAELVLHRTTNEMLAGYHGGQEISVLDSENDPRKAEQNTFRIGASPEVPESSSQVSSRQKGQKAGREVVQSKPESRLRQVMSADEQSDAASKVSKANKLSRR